MARPRKYGPGADGQHPASASPGDETPWAWEKGFGRQSEPEFNVVPIDYGIKRNILRLLAGEGCKVMVVPGHDIG